MYIINKRGTRTNPCDRPFSRRRKLLWLSQPVVGVKLRLQTSFMIIEILRLSGRRCITMQVRPRCHTVSQAAVKSTNTAAAFSSAEKLFSIFSVKRVNWFTVDFPRRNLACARIRNGQLSPVATARRSIIRQESLWRCRILIVLMCPDYKSLKVTVL